jgi:hypothetical protein
MIQPFVVQLQEHGADIGNRDRTVAEMHVGRGRHAGHRFAPGLD